MRIISVTFTAKPDRIEEFRTTLLEHAQASLTNEPGCRQFDVAGDPKNSARFYIYEVYDDEAAIAAHNSSAHFKLRSPKLRELAASIERNDFAMLARSPTPKR